MIEEKAKPFFLLKKKNIIFGMNGKIFRYPNKVNCLRIVIAVYYSNFDASAAEKEKDKANRLKDINAIDEEEEDDSDMMESEEAIEEVDEKAGLKKKPR